MRYFKAKFDDEWWYYKVENDYSAFWVFPPNHLSWLKSKAQVGWTESSTKVCTEISEAELFIEIL